MTQKKLSDTRQKILDVIKHSNKHMTADDIHLQLRMDKESIGIATVYRNLNYLHEHGHLRRIEDLELGYIYDCGLHKHYHFKCRVCLEVTDVEVPDQNALNEMVQEEIGAISVTHDILFEGICKNCQEKVE